MLNTYLLIANENLSYCTGYLQICINAPIKNHSWGSTNIDAPRKDTANMPIAISENRLLGIKRDFKNIFKIAAYNKVVKIEP